MSTHLISSAKEIKNNFKKTRKAFLKFIEPLKTEDFVVQPVVDVSPPKWHLAHSTWFFENFVLVPWYKGYQLFNKDYNYFFNSYYESQGDRVMRPQRGYMTRPTVQEVLDYRAWVDRAMENFLDQAELDQEQQYMLEVGINHEQQHHELFFYDLKYILGVNPLFPVYSGIEIPSLNKEKKANWLGVNEGIYEIGHDFKSFAYDNEGVRHKVYLQDFIISDTLVTNGEYLEFIKAGGYQDYRFWLSDAWDWIKNEQLTAPFHWHYLHGDWYEFTLHGLQKLDLYAPVTHISYYEADAYADWKGMRLPTEFEWEVAAKNHAATGEGFIDSGLYQPKNQSWLGSVWQWTSSAYLPYPGFQKPAGGLGEYNGKFMVNQMVLRGASCVTWKQHARITYRNFFHPHLRWMFSGIRLASSL